MARTHFGKDPRPTVLDRALGRAQDPPSQILGQQIAAVRAGEEHIADGAMTVMQRLTSSMMLRSRLDEEKRSLFAMDCGLAAPADETQQCFTKQRALARLGLSGVLHDGGDSLAKFFGSDARISKMLDNGRLESERLSAFASAALQRDAAPPAAPRPAATPDRLPPAYFAAPRREPRRNVDLAFHGKWTPLEKGSVADECRESPHLLPSCPCEPRVIATYKTEKPLEGGASLRTLTFECCSCGALAERTRSKTLLESERGLRALKGERHESV